MTERIGLLIGIYLNVLVAEHTFRHTNLQIVEPRCNGGILPECFFRDTPAYRNRWEDAPTLAVGKTRRTIGAHIGLEEIAVLERIVHPAEERQQRVFGQ